MGYYTVQIVEHVNHTAIIEAESQGAAEQLAIEDVNNPIFQWVRMEGPNSCEVCLEDGDFIEADYSLESSSNA